MNSRVVLAVAVAVALAAVGFAMPGLSGATFTARSSTGSQVSSAFDWTAPSVSMSAPTGTLSGSTSLSATASDARSSIASVTIQYAASAGAPWTSVCTATTGPWTCSWSTTDLADGDYLLRAVATDAAGNVATSASVAASVVNAAPTVTLVAPPGEFRGTVTLRSALTNPGAKSVAGFRIESTPVDESSWTTISGCTSSTLSLTCTWTPETGSYDLRAVAVIGGTTYTDVITDVLVDNVAPSVSMQSPGSLVSGIVTLAATATDDDSDVAAVVIERAVNGGSVWTPLCTIDAPPYSCRFDTTTISDGSYDLRAVATDLVGNSATSSVQKKITVNNSVASVSVESPGARIARTVTLLANANSSNGVSSVTIQAVKQGSGGSFAAICSDTTAPYSCSWVTTSVTDGSYDLRAVLTDKKGIVTTSATISTIVDNSALRAADVQAVNRAGGTLGRIQSGDQVVFTYSSQIDPNTLLPGWVGTARGVTARLQDGQLFSGGSSTDDRFSVDGVNLGETNLRGGFLGKRKTVTVPSTMVLSTKTVGTSLVSVVTITFGTPSGSLTTSTSLGAMVWTPSVLVKNLTGTACSSAPATESGTADRDF